MIGLLDSLIPEVGRLDEEVIRASIILVTCPEDWMR